MASTRSLLSLLPAATAVPVLAASSQRQRAAGLRQSVSCAASGAGRLLQTRIRGLQGGSASSSSGRASLLALVASSAANSAMAVSEERPGTAAVVEEEKIETENQTACAIIPGELHRLSLHTSATNRNMGGGSMLPHPPPAAAAAANESRGASSRLADGDGVVIVDHGSRRAQSNAMLHEFVKMYKEETGHQLVEAAHMELATPTIADAFDQCVEQGATRIIICPYFLFPGRHWDKDIPALAAEAAKKHPRVSYIVTAPIGLHKLMVTVIQDRMEYCLLQAGGEISECDMCKGTGRCKQLICPEYLSTTATLGSSIGTLTPT